MNNNVKCENLNFIKIYKKIVKKKFTEMFILCDIHYHYYRYYR